MQLHYTFLAVALTTLTTATPLHARAGGPIGKPIPSNCTQTNPVPNSTHNSGTVVPIDGTKPSSDFLAQNLLYQSYFSTPSSFTDEDLAKQCFRQCYGYGDGKQCISALSARNVPVPEGHYGSSGGDLMSACLMFEEFLNPGVFVKSDEGTWEGVLGVDISCPEE